MKWINNGIQYRRGCYEFLIARYDGGDVWFVHRANIISQQSQKGMFKRLGEYLGAKTCEVLPMYDENDECTQDNIVVYDFSYNGEECRFYRLQDDGSLEHIAGVF